MCTVICVTPLGTHKCVLQFTYKKKQFYKCVHPNLMHTFKINSDHLCATFLIGVAQIESFFFLKASCAYMCLKYMRSTNVCYVQVP